ncbi:thiolase family protein [Roseomonas marmotae]|uniref:Thiolase family protein n=1 Tax=Roseomonas marmotae TaxID=2768161 RepID=A0ABS3KHL4_9PROT|nr:thiolase family protein [Roseomonas marmotae]MBO1076935.1 thiolase family protein [Roseomonas marmotae]QTI82074.1 thiolase family protein [Roseomonas marmotae]
MRGSCVIAGIGATAFGKLPGRSTLSLNVEACRRALEDARVPKDAVDAVFVKTPTSTRELLYGQKLAEALGLQPRMGFALDQGGAANLSLIAIATMAIEAGQCEVVLVCYADNPRSGSRAVYARPRGDDAVFGWFSTAAGYAMIQRRFMADHGVPEEAFGEVAVACRAHGAANPAAQLRKPLSLDEYMAAPPMIAPMRREDVCLVSDGGAAVLVMSAARARQLGVPAPVPILGFGFGQTSWEVPLRPDLSSTEAKRSAATAFAMAGITPKDVQVAQIYDCFTVTVLMTLEDYGLCEPGGSHAFVRDGRIRIGGSLPINTAGGLLSETGMPGLQLVQEAVRQVRGTAVLQVPAVRHALVTNQGGTMHSHGTLILGG